MTDRDRIEFKDLVREVIQEEFGEKYRWVTRAEIMQITGKCADTIYRWKKSGRIKTKKVGGLIMYQI